MTSHPHKERSSPARFLYRAIQFLLFEIWIAAGCYAAVFVLWAVLVIFGREVEGVRIFQETLFPFAYLYLAVQLGRVWYWMAKMKRRRQERDYYPRGGRRRKDEEDANSEHHTVST